MEETPPEYDFASAFESVFHNLYNDEVHFQNTNKLEQLYLNQKHKSDKKTRITDKQYLVDFVKNTICTNKSHGDSAWRMMLKSPLSVQKYVPLIFMESDKMVTSCTHFDGYCISCFTSAVMKSAFFDTETEKISFECPDCEQRLSFEMFVKNIYVVNIGKRGRPKSTEKKLSQSPPELLFGSPPPPPPEYMDKKPTFYRAKPINT